jgi:serine/threonine-protein kinase
VRINVSQGVKQVAVPPVVGEPYDQAVGELETAGFKVSRRDVSSSDPAGTVVEQSPAGNTLQTPGSTVTLSVSKGPQTATVPDVTLVDEESAKATLVNAGFKVTVTKVATADQSQDGVVLSQTPEGNTEAQIGSTVALVVGKYTPPATTPTITVPPSSTAPPATDTTATDTTGTSTTP